MEFETTQAKVETTGSEDETTEPELDQKPHVCHTCYEIFDSEDQLKLHSQLCGLKTPESAEQDDSIGVVDFKTEPAEWEVFVCDMCYLAFESEEAYKEHKLTESVQDIVKPEPDSDEFEPDDDEEEDVDEEEGNEKIIPI